VGGDLEADLVAQTLDIPKLKFLLGDTNFEGKARLTGLDQAMPSVSFDLAGDSLNEMSAITLQLKAKDGQLSIPTLAASLYDGSIDSNANLDVRNNTPRYSADAKISGVQAQPLLAAAAEFEQLRSMASTSPPRAARSCAC